MVSDLHALLHEQNPWLPFSFPLPVFDEHDDGGSIQPLVVHAPRPFVGVGSAYHHRSLGSSHAYEETWV